jgi:acetyl-CoA carboxylase carboxyl transferase subunit beta
MVDMVVHRHKLRPTLAELCRVLTKSNGAPVRPALPALPPAAPETWAAQV